MMNAEASSRQLYVVRNGERSLEFEGDLLAESSSYALGKARWIEMSLYRTRGGNYVLAGCGRTKIPGETNREWAHICEDARGVVETLYLHDQDDVKYLTRVARRLLQVAGTIDPDLRRVFLLDVVK